MKNESKIFDLKNLSHEAITQNLLNRIIIVFKQFYFFAFSKIIYFLEQFLTAKLLFTVSRGERRRQSRRSPPKISVKRQPPPVEILNCSVDCAAAGKNKTLRRRCAAGLFFAHFSAQSRDNCEWICFTKYKIFFF